MYCALERPRLVILIGLASLAGVTLAQAVDRGDLADWRGVVARGDLGANLHSRLA